MPRFNNLKAPQKPTWFDWLPTWLQCALLLLVTVPVTILFLALGMHCVHTGQPIVLVSKRTDASSWFLYFAIFALISGYIFAVMIGLAKPGRPHVSETHHRPK